MASAVKAGAPAPAATPPKRTRIASVDIMRGFTMLWMIMVDNQGSHVPGEIWYPWRESDWNGLGPADCVFPAFLFLVGFSVVLALTKFRTAWAGASTPEARTAVLRTVGWKVTTRFLKLFLIGAFINLWAGNFHFGRWVVMGVLQRIAVCYALLAVGYVFLPSIWALRAAVVAALLLYSGIMYGLHVPGCGRAVLTPGCNAGGYASRQFWGAAHVPPDGTIPEALVSTLAALATTHAGLEFSLVMRRVKGAPRSLLLLLWGTLSAAYIIAGAVLTLAVPLNKKIWSPPFALVVAGVAGAVMTGWLFAVDLRCGADLPPRWWALSCTRFASTQTAVTALSPAPRVTRSVNAPASAAAGDDKPGEALSAPLLGGMPESKQEPAGARAARVDAALGKPGPSPVQPCTPCCGVVCCGCCGGPAALAALRAANQAVDWLVLQPLTWLGRNPAFVFIAMVALEVLLMDTLKVKEHDNMPVWTYWYEQGFVPHALNAQAASSAVALVHLALWTGIAGVMHHYKVFITL